MPNRIPRAAQLVLRLLPAAPAGRILAGAIVRNAWTFAGSGRFRVAAPGIFEIEATPRSRGTQHRPALPLRPDPSGDCNAAGLRPGPLRRAP